MSVSEEQMMRDIKKYPFASSKSFYLCGKFVPVSVPCPKCGAGDNDGALINPKTGVCPKCKFNSRALSDEKFAKIFGYEG